MLIRIRKRHLAVGAGLALALAIRVQADSGSQSRTCRSIILILNPAGSELQVLSSTPTGGGQGVVLSYTSQPPGLTRRTRQIMCVFNRNRIGSDDLLALLSDGRTLGPVRLAFIKRFWLTSVEARAAERAFGGAPAR